MTHSQKTLFGETTNVVRNKRTHGVKTKKQLYNEGREARDSLERTLVKIGKIIDDFPKRDEYDNIIAQIEYLATTPHYKLLQVCSERGVSTWINQIVEQSEFLIKQCKRGTEAKGREWVKFRASFGKCGVMYFTCCGIHVGGNRWVVMSTKGQVRCRKCFVAEYGNSQFKSLREEYPS